MLCQMPELDICGARYLVDFIHLFTIFDYACFIMIKSRQGGVNYLIQIYKDCNSFCTQIVFTFLFFIMLLGCAQVGQIPEQVSKELPNPVSDFTEKDRYVVGLRWYQEGSFDIAGKFWKPLAEGGDCDAQYSMGLLYYEGAGVGKSYGRAVELWTGAARQGHVQAQIALGAVYSHIRIPYTALNCKKGCGEEKDLIGGYKWFGLASKLGSPREVRIAERSINRIGAEMTPAQIGEAKSKIEDWKPIPSQCKPRGVYIS